MPLRLKRPKELPKDGYLYTESNGRKFGGMFSFAYVANEILAYRKGNNLPRATASEAYHDLDAYTCNRDPSLCYDTSVTVGEQIRQTKSSGCCGGITPT
jgi:hypothetical protein